VPRAPEAVLFASLFGYVMLLLHTGLRPAMFKIGKKEKNDLQNFISCQFEALQRKREIIMQNLCSNCEKKCEILQPCAGCLMADELTPELLCQECQKPKWKKHMVELEKKNKMSKFSKAIAPRTESQNQVEQKKENAPLSNRQIDSKERQPKQPNQIDGKKEGPLPNRLDGILQRIKEREREAEKKKNISSY
jgi:hypothetical protein